MCGQVDQLRYCRTCRIGLSIHMCDRLRTLFSGNAERIVWVVRPAVEPYNGLVHPADFECPILLDHRDLDTLVFQPFDHVDELSPDDRGQPCIIRAGRRITA